MRDSIWHSLHIHFDGPIYGTQCDRLLRRVVVPFVSTAVQNEWIDQFFFVRYIAEGPHVRLRMRSGMLSHLLARNANRAIVELAASLGSDKVELRWTPYEPEYERYGGRRGVYYAERFFVTSSSAALEVLSEAMTERQRLGRALLLMICLLRVVARTPQRAVDFTSKYSEGYIRRLALTEALSAEQLGIKFDTTLNGQSTSMSAVISRAWQASSRLSKLPVPAAGYLSDLRCLRASLKAALRREPFRVHGTIVRSWNDFMGLVGPSYMHMMNNRLGVSIPQEAFLARAISTVLMTEFIGSRAGADNA